ncbi:hypothetical protein BP5796_10932 [Coleophoma crateriformis]|uniref:Uncharacterized protein n=1 Tax=Coleophoma crateriformis TaxID=565419 RepID=A0A3D8QLV5_9HELO|nr:hypothetical protein BP5796_10932 [Coleophoma crateriformis]
MAKPHHRPSTAERDFTLQKYLLLYSQHDAVRKNISEILPRHYSTTTRTSPSSPSHSPDRHSSFSSSGSDDGFYLSSSPPRTFRNHIRGGSIAATTSCSRRASLPALAEEQQRTSRALSAAAASSGLGERTLELVWEQEMKLMNVNQQIKSTLTELLNCDAVKADQAYRMWVQSRLMDTEKELKTCKSRNCERRRSDEVSAVF